MRLATWNIRAGGGKRTAQIAQALRDEALDVAVLTEYRTRPGQALLDSTKPLSTHSIEGVPTGVQNCVCVLSQTPLVPLASEPVPTSHHRWSAVTVPDHGIDILGVHVPNQDEVWNKREFWDCVVAFAESAVHNRCVILGDLNTALDEDCQGDPIREAVYFKQLLAMGWVDAWRQCHPDAREYSWLSHRANGFRIDHCMVSPSLAPNVASAHMRHDVRTDRLSDHSMLVVEIRT